MHIYHPDTECRGRFTGARNRIGNIVELEIKKHIVPLLSKRLYQPGPGTGKQFLTDLQPTTARLQTGYKLLRLTGVGIIQRYDHARVCEIFFFHSTCSVFIGFTLLQHWHPGHCQNSFRLAKPHSSQR